MKYKFLDSIITISKREVVFNRDQLRAYRNDELSLAEIKYSDNMMLKVMSDESLKRTFVFLLACTFIVFKVNTPAAASEPNMDKIDGFGYRVLGYIRGFAYWICIIMCIAEIIKDIMQGADKSSIGKIILKYVLAFAALFIVPQLFDMIKESF